MQKNKIFLITILIIFLIFSLNITIGRETNNAIVITKMNFTNNVLNITYEFNNENFIGDEISLEVWITNESGTEMNRLIDSFSINRDSPIKRNILIQIPRNIIKQLKKSSQIIYANIALSSELNNPTKQQFIIQKSEKKQLSINKTLIYLISFIILIIIIFILINFSKRKIYSPLLKRKYKNKGLLPEIKK